MMGDFSNVDLHAFWFSACTGLNLRDIYYGSWEIQADRIVVHSGKNLDYRAGRSIPLIFNPALIGLHVGFSYGAHRKTYPFCSTQTTAKAVKALRPGWMLKEARKSFAHWLHSAHVLGSRCVAYQGHSDGENGPEQIDTYREHDVDPLPSE